MLNMIIAGLLVLVGVIHLLPVSGMLGARRLAALYGVSVADPNLEILLRHRALLFALLGLFLIAAALRPALHLPAILAGLASLLSFILLAKAVGGYNAAIGKVVAVDYVACAALALAFVLYLLRRLGIWLAVIT